MKISCNIIQDLLPLHHEELCHVDSQKLIEDHLKDCEDCQNYLKRMRTNQIDERIKTESENMIDNFTQKIKKQTIIYGLVIAMLISVIPPFVVNLSVTGGRLDWFFIVLTGTMLFGTLTITPLVIEKRKGLWTLIGSTMSLLLLLFTIYSYSSGNKPTEGMSWFAVASLSTLFTVGAVLFIDKLMRKK